MFVIERLIDLAARRHGFDRVRCGGAISYGRGMPYRNPLGLLYDSGDYAAARIARSLAPTGTASRKRRLEARHRGRYRGIASQLRRAHTGGAARARRDRGASGRRVDVVLGTLSAARARDELRPARRGVVGVGLEQVRLITGDTDLAPVRRAARTPRSMRLGAS